MIKLDLMELADCFTPEELVDEIYRQCPYLSPPIPVKEICGAVGIDHISSIPTEGVEGILVADEEKTTGIIQYKEDSPLGRKRFTIGHELGHFLLLHHSSEQSCSSSDIKIGSNKGQTKGIEDEANRFSQLLLMPDKFVSEAVNGKSPDINLLKSIADTFQMSFEAIANKCSSVSNVPFALVYSKDRIVRYCWRDWDNFSHKMVLKKSSPMPVSSQAVQLGQPSETISTMQEVKDISDWILPNYKSGFPKELLEQTYTQLDGYQVTMILVVQ